MALTKGELAALLNGAHESPNIELKGWVDPSTEEAIAKVAQGCMALRNNNGGSLVIGSKNDGQPDQENFPSDVTATFARRQDSAHCRPLWRAPTFGGSGRCSHAWIRGRGVVLM